MNSNAVNAANSAVQHEGIPISIYTRLKRVFGPVLPGLVLDSADFFSLTRTVGPWASFPIGFAIGVWLSLFYPFNFGWRLVIALASGLYTLTPGTEYIPLATILTCLGRFIESSPETRMTTTDATSRDCIVADDEPVRRGPSTPIRAACPECGSSSLRYGAVAQQFVPSGSSVWAKGHEVNAFVCLECGFLGHYLASSDLEKLRESNGA